MVSRTTIKGGPELRARLDNLVAEVPEGCKQEWADEAAKRMRSKAPRGSGSHGIHLADSFEVRDHSTGGYSLGAAVFGAYWGIFVDRGAKASVPKRRQVLKFEKGGQTIFARKVKRRRRRPFASESAQSALADMSWVDIVQKAWAGRRLTGRGRATRSSRFIGG